VTLNVTSAISSLRNANISGAFFSIAAFVFLHLCLFAVFALLPFIAE